MPEQDRQSLAAEVIEMGEQLFALALEGRQENSQPALPLAEIEAASELALSLCLQRNVRNGISMREVDRLFAVCGGRNSHNDL